MAHVPAERCLGIIELLADGAGAMPLGEIAERLACPRAARIGCSPRWSISAGRSRMPRPASTGSRCASPCSGSASIVATGIPDICQPLLDRLARECREFVRLAVVDGDSLVWVAHAQGAVGRPRCTSLRCASNTVPLYATASGKAWLVDAPRRRGDADRRAQRRLRRGRPLRPERGALHRRADARARRHGASRLRARAERGGARRHRARRRHPGREDRRGARHRQHRRARACA